MSDRADPDSHIQLKIAALLEPLLERLLDNGAHRWAGGGLHEGIHLGSQRVVGGQRRSVDKAFNVSQREKVETGDPLRERIDKLYKLSVGKGSVDVPVPLG